MPLTSSYRKDMYLIVDGHICYVLDRQYKTQGRGGGLIILKMRNVEDGHPLTKTLKEGQELEEIFPETVSAQYLYDDGDQLLFMDSKSFENLSVNADVLGKKRSFLKEGESYLLLVHDERVINVKIPPKMNLKVVEAPESVKGNTVSSATKVVTVEGGLKITVPLFIKEGETISVNTETCEYSGRAK
jgi:elongation factor P